MNKQSPPKRLDSLASKSQKLHLILSICVPQCIRKGIMEIYLCLFCLNLEIKEQRSTPTPTPQKILADDCDDCQTEDKLVEEYSEEGGEKRSCGKPQLCILYSKEMSCILTITNLISPAKMAGSVRLFLAN